MQSEAQIDWKLRAVAVLKRLVLGYLATTQDTLVVALHAGWIILLVIGFQAGPATTQAVGSSALALLVKLGGSTGSGHVQHLHLSNILEAWAQLAGLFYALQLAYRWVRGERPRWTGAQKIALSTAVAAAGYGVALLLVPHWPGQLAGIEAVVGVFVVLVCLGTSWSVGLGWGLELLDALTWPTPLLARAGPPRPPGPPPRKTPRPIWILAAGFTLGLAALVTGLVLPPVHLPPGPRTTAERAAFCSSAQDCEQKCGPTAPAACSIAAEHLVRDGAAPAEKLEALWRKGCELGDPLGCDALADRLARSAKPETIAALYQRGCGRDDATACDRLGQLYAHGQGTLRADPVRSATFLKKACALGQPDACHR